MEKNNNDLCLMSTVPALKVIERSDGKYFGPGNSGLMPFIDLFHCMLVCYFVVFSNFLFRQF